MLELVFTYQNKMRGAYLLGSSSTPSLEINDVNNRTQHKLNTGQTQTKHALQTCNPDSVRDRTPITLNSPCQRQKDRPAANQAYRESVSMQDRSPTNGTAKPESERANQASLRPNGSMRGTSLKSYLCTSSTSLPTACQSGAAGNDATWDWTGNFGHFFRVEARIATESILLDGGMAMR